MNVVSKKPIIGGIILAVIVGIIFVGSQINPDNPENINFVFHVTLADPALYDEKGLYNDFFILEKGVYEFRFVPNGDSPTKLSIELWAIEAGKEKRSTFAEDFQLQGSLVEDEFSSWYIWDYLGEKRIIFDESYTMEIVISPNRNLVGPVSIDLIKLR